MTEIIRDDVRIEIPDKVPVLPLRDLIMFPYMVFPLLVGKAKSLQAVQQALDQDKILFLTAQKNFEREEPLKKDLCRVGVLCQVLQVVKLPNGFIKILVEGLVRGRIARFMPQKEYFEARVAPIEDETDVTTEMQALTRQAITLFREYVNLNRDIPDELLLTMDNMGHPQKIADFIVAHTMLDVYVKQKLLESETTSDYLLALAKALDGEIEILKIEKLVEDKVRNRIQKSQRNFYLQEQIRVLKEELDDEAEEESEISQLRARIVQAKLPESAQEKAIEELNRLAKMPQMSPEATVIRNYLDWVLALPWHERTEDALDINQAAKILDEDHFGLRKTKERILEYLAVLQQVRKLKGPILCLVGPPGVGKTSLGRSIARAMDRNFVRISLGGVRDEAEIRGHRRTYIGSMPGRIIQSMKRAKSVNPVFLLDEIDKMNADFRGDPSSALLEVLDPEQNVAFNDHYLEVDYDLSDVFFITTANVRDNIPEPLLDRMEIIELPGYLEIEKAKIAEGFLIPRQLEQHGLTDENIHFTRNSLETLIRQYTREAGVRELERKIATVCRKVTREIVSERLNRKVAVSARNLNKYLGVPPYSDRGLRVTKMVGTATGLAWTRFGGEILQIEVSLMPGKGELTLTGNLGDVMKESARAALSFIRSHAAELKIDVDFYQKIDIHIHVPEGAIPKDGPSAGVTMMTALVSALTGRAVRQDLAMTGEVTLRGHVLAIGGLNEKIMAAKRVGVTTVIMPNENEKNLADLPKELTAGIEIILAAEIEDVLKNALLAEDKK